MASAVQGFRYRAFAIQTQTARTPSYDFLHMALIERAGLFSGQGIEFNILGSRVYRAYRI